MAAARAQHFEDMSPHDVYVINRPVSAGAGKSWLTVGVDLQYAWKIGVTQSIRGGIRPSTFVRECNAVYGGGCSAQIVARNLEGYYLATLRESMMLTAYQDDYGVCPEWHQGKAVYR
jgi:hypothetical protein